MAEDEVAALSEKNKCAPDGQENAYKIGFPFLLLVKNLPNNLYHG